MGTSHPLFEAYPLRGTTEISVGTVPLPYHVYDGYGTFIGGTASLSGVEELLAGEDVEPMTDEAGHALMGIWLCDFTDANLGPHHELQVSIFVSRGAAPPIRAHPLGLLGAMLTRDDLEMLCHGLWNNTGPVVAYNREVFSLNARLSDSQLTRTDEALVGTVQDVATGAPLLTTRLSKPNRAGIAATFGLLGQLGLARAIKVNRQPWVEMRVVNPLGVRLDRNSTATACASNSTNRLRTFDPSVDELELRAEAYASLDFRPQFVQHMTGFTFVYEEPL